MSITVKFTPDPGCRFSCGDEERPLWLRWLVQHLGPVEVLRIAPRVIRVRLVEGLSGEVQTEHRSPACGARDADTAPASPSPQTFAPAASWAQRRG